MNRMNKQKKRIRWGSFFTYLIVSFPLFLVVVWLGSFTFASYSIEIPVIPVAAAISVIACLCFAWKTDEEHSDEEEYYRVMAKHQSSQPKKKSVIGSAVVGSIIAGPVGGVVGAIHAADTNAQNRAEGGSNT